MACRFRAKTFVATAVCSLAASTALLSAQTSSPQPITSLPKPPLISNFSGSELPAYSSSAASPSIKPVTLISSDPEIALLHAWTNAPASESAISLPPQPWRFHPFSVFAAQVTASFDGIGIQLASPLTHDFNLRGGGSFITYATIYSANGLNAAGQINLRTANVSLDWYPFHNGFRVSPGVTLYNGNHVSATLSVPGGQNFNLGDGTYTSSPSDPVHGIGSLALGKRTVPSFTVGWGNMIPRNGRRLSIPIEIGFQYIGPPKVNFNLAGTACRNTDCANIATDPTSQADLQQEITNIDNQIAPLRFYPIISIGLAWTFGSHSTRTY
jgi:hypothetical protein